MPEYFGDGLFEILKDKIKLPEKGQRPCCKEMYPLSSDTIIPTVLPQGMGSSVLCLGVGAAVSYQVFGKFLSTSGLVRGPGESWAP